MPGSRLGFATGKDPAQIIFLPYATSFLTIPVYLGFMFATLWCYIMAYQLLASIILSSKASFD